MVRRVLPRVRGGRKVEDGVKKPKRRMGDGRNGLRGRKVGTFVVVVAADA